LPENGNNIGSNGSENIERESEPTKTLYRVRMKDAGELAWFNKGREPKPERIKKD